MKSFGYLAALLAAGVSTAAQATTNLVVNGDFSQGNTGFTTGYTYATPAANALMPETRYTITADPNSVHPYWVSLGADNPLMIVNGATHAGVTVWQESVATTAGLTYQFSASAADVCCNSAHPGTYAPSELELQVSDDNFATFQTLAAINTAPPGDAGQFITASGQFTATGAMQVRVIDALTGRVGNDFALDDLSVIALPISGSGVNAPGEPSAAPEPASWALMISGFGSLGVTIRRRRGRMLAAA